MLLRGNEQKRGKKKTKEEKGKEGKTMEGF